MLSSPVSLSRLFTFSQLTATDLFNSYLAELELLSLVPLEVVTVIPERRNPIVLLVGFLLLLAHLVEQRRPAFGEAFAWQRDRA